MLINISLQAQMLEVSGGIKSINVSKGDVDFVYIDESPVPDILVTRVPFKGSRSVISIAFDYEGFNDEQRIFGILRLQGYFGEIKGVDANVGLAYPLYLNALGSLRLHPEICVAYGFNEKKMGTLNVQATNSVYIKVNNTRYEDFASVDIASQNNYFALRPAMKAAVRINPSSELRFFGGFHIALGKTKSSVSFTGPASSGETVTERESLGNSNVFFHYNGENTSVNPFSVKGLELRIGFAFHLQ